MVKFPNDAALTKGLHQVETDQDLAELATKLKLNQLNHELVAHCQPRISTGLPPGAVALDGAANATARNTVNMLPRGVQTSLRNGQTHECCTYDKSSSEENSNEMVTLVYATNVGSCLKVLQNVNDVHDWTDLGTIWISSSEPTEKHPKDSSLLILWYPKHVMFQLPVADDGDEGAAITRLQANELCRQMTLEMARPHLASTLMGHNGELDKSKACPGALRFVESFEKRLHELRVADESVFPPSMSQEEERQTILAKLAEETGVDFAYINVQPFSALFRSNDDQCDKCHEARLMAAFQNLIMTRGGCTFCHTSDFVVKRAKKSNMHGCDLEIAYDGRTYCIHVAKEMQWQMMGMLPGMFGGARGGNAPKKEGH